jgi:hypothetical protein
MGRMELWSMALAVGLPSAVAAVIAYFLKRRALFWGVVIGAVIGWFFLRPLVSAQYDDPLDELTTEFRLGLQGTVPGSICGLAAGWIISRVSGTTRLPN